MGLMYILYKSICKKRFKEASTKKTVKQKSPCHSSLTLQWRLNCLFNVGKVKSTHRLYVKDAATMMSSISLSSSFFKTYLVEV